MFRITSRGSFKNTESFLRKAPTVNIQARLHKAGAEGVRALSASTPVDTGLTSASWDYEIVRGSGSTSIVWTNTHGGDTPIAIMLQYGHGTGTGGYVQGRDYINPAMSPIFDRIAEEVWKAVTSA